MARSVINQKLRDRVKNAKTAKELRPKGQTVAVASPTEACLIPDVRPSSRVEISQDLAQQYLVPLRDDPAAVLGLLKSADLTPEVKDAIRAWLARSEHSDAATLLGKKRATSLDADHQSMAATKLAAQMSRKQRSERATKAATARWSRK